MTDDFLFCGENSASHRLVLLHGWGADAEDLVQLGLELVKDQAVVFDVIALRAPERLDQVSVGRAWYPLFPADWEVVPGAINDLQSRLKGLPERNGVPLERTILLGFSQGGAMALAAGCDLPFMGLICCSAYPHPNWIAPIKCPPVFLTHGKKDEIVNYLASEAIFKTLQLNKLKVDLMLFDGGHEIPQKVLSRLIDLISSWCTI